VNVFLRTWIKCEVTFEGKEYTDLSGIRTKRMSNLLSVVGGGGIVDSGSHNGPNS
jgi:hypothetical protein